MGSSQVYRHVFRHRAEIQKRGASWPQRDRLAIDLIPVLAMTQPLAAENLKSLVRLRVSHQHPFPSEPGLYFRTCKEIGHDAIPLSEGDLPIILPNVVFLVHGPFF